MSLDFLTLAPDGPPARSPLADRSFAGASLQRRGGWEVVASYGDAEGEARACRESVGWTDVSHLPKAELRGPSASSQAPSPGTAERRGEGWLCPITPRRALLIGETGPPGEGSLIDLTSSLAAISIGGPGARESIARFCAIDTRAAALPPAGFRPGSIARTPGYLLREDSDRFLLLFGAAFGRYIWEVVADAGGRLGGRPVGLEAIASRSSAEEVAANA